MGCYAWSLENEAGLPYSFLRFSESLVPPDLCGGEWLEGLGGAAGDVGGGSWKTDPSCPCNPFFPQKPWRKPPLCSRRPTSSKHSTVPSSPALGSSGI